MIDLHITDQLLYLTARIKAYSSERESIGTGFFFSFDIDGNSAPFLITNKHVINECTEAEVHFCCYNDSSSTYRQASLFTINLTGYPVIKHPNREVDLCAIPVAPFLDQICSTSGNMYFYIDESLIPSQEDLDDLLSIEEVVMVGYPSGLYDEINECPLVRRGITATPARYNYNGLPRFLVDMACYEGSSGSPILIVHQSAYATRAGVRLGGAQCFLLGIQCSMYRREQDGTFKIIDIPTTTRSIPVIEESINLGIAINARCILDLKPLIKEAFRL